ncbi:hypothetical protein J3E68DRAFT_411123 [Trichoderma sp. SZMC 28012]
MTYLHANQYQDGMGWDGMLPSELYSVLVLRTAQATCYLHLPTCTWDAVQYTRMYMQQRASVEFCWASPSRDAMPLSSSGTSHWYLQVSLTHC